MKKTPATPAHCWAPVLDHGGQVPVYMEADPSKDPVRFVATTHGKQLETHFQCCWCGKRGTRKFQVTAKEGHGPHRSHYDLPEVTSLPDEVCPSAPAAPAPATS